MSEDIFWKTLNSKISKDNWQYIDYYILQSYLRSGKELIIVDVSEENNEKYFMSPQLSYLTIPLKKIIDESYKLENQNKMIVCVCMGGPKSSVAAQILRFKGMDAIYLSGGIKAIESLPQSN